MLYTYWKMLRISHGQQQRPAMQYCSAVWSRGEISGWANCEKIERIRRAHAQRHVTAPLKKVKKVKIRINNPAKPFLACISIKILVFRRALMKQEESCIGTYARLVFRLKAKHFLIRKQIVVNLSQKTSNSGQVTCRACPLS